MDRKQHLMAVRRWPVDAVRCMLHSVIMQQIRPDLLTSPAAGIIGKWEAPESNGKMVVYSPEKKEINRVRGDTSNPFSLKSPPSKTLQF